MFIRDRQAKRRVGSRSLDWKGRRKIEGKAVFGYNSHDYLGSISLADLPQETSLDPIPERY